VEKKKGGRGDGENTNNPEKNKRGDDRLEEGSCGDERRIEDESEKFGEKTGHDGKKDKGNRKSNN